MCHHVRKHFWTRQRINIFETFLCFRLRARSLTNNQDLTLFPPHQATSESQMKATFFIFDPFGRLLYSGTKVGVNIAWEKTRRRGRA